MQDKYYLKIGRASELKESKERRFYRFLEIFPGLLVWLTLLVIVAGSYFIPVFFSLFIIAFDIYWLIKTIYLTLHMRSSFFKMRANLKRKWIEELDRINYLPQELKINSWHDIYHLIILPMAYEPIEVVRESFKSLVSANYPKDKIIVVLATEERVGERAQVIARAVEKEFGSSFFKFLVTVHPKDLPGEISGKGSNESWAGRKAKETIIGLNIPYEQIITSVFDIDTVIPPDFLACLTWNYLTAEKPLQSSYQPIPLFINNIWQAPAFARVFAFSTTFWQMIQQARPEQLITFSSQSIPFKAVVDVDFWQTNVVSEDSRIFWQCFLYYDGNWQTLPMYFPVYMDANVAPTLWQTAKNQYKQIRRWHWGSGLNRFSYHPAQQ